MNELRLVLASLVAIAGVVGSARAGDVASEKADSTSITLYRDEDSPSTDDIFDADDWYARHAGTGFVVERRSVDLPAGPSIIRFGGVASTMVPQSATIDGLPEGVAEQNLDYDLLSPGALLAKSVGRTVSVVRTDPKTGHQTTVNAIVRTGPDGVLLENGGHLEALKCGSLPEKVVLDAVPDGLSDVPTLSARVVVPEAGHYALTLSYLATGLNWSADYVGRIAPDGKTLDLSGWLTLANFSANNFQNVPLSVVAGKLNRVEDADEPVDAAERTFNARCWPTKFHWEIYDALRRRMSGEGRSMDVQTVPIAITVFKDKNIDPVALADYKLYRLPEPAVMAAKQIKQVQFLDRKNVPFDKHYSLAFRNGGFAAGNDSGEVNGDEPAVVVIRLANDTGSGEALPKGHVAVQAPDANGSPVFLGQGGIADTPAGQPVDINVGRTGDVRVEYRATRAKHRSDDGADIAVDIRIRNGKTDPIMFELFEVDSQRITSESRPHGHKTGFGMWSFSLNPGEHASLQYTIDYPAD